MTDVPERTEAFPACTSALKLTFDGRALVLHATGGSKTYAAATGKRGPDFSLEAQRDRNRGAIPAGRYWIDPEQMWTSGPLVDFLRHVPILRQYPDGWGHHRITIHISPQTETYGRGGFFIHGGIHEGSAGCVHVTGDGMEAFLADLKAALGGLPRCSVSLDVSYP